jgi:hypothetical protein
MRLIKVVVQIVGVLVGGFLLSAAVVLLGQLGS